MGINNLQPMLLYEMDTWKNGQFPGNNDHIYFEPFVNPRFDYCIKPNQLEQLALLLKRKYKTYEELLAEFQELQQ